MWGNGAMRIWLFHRQRRNGAKYQALCKLANQNILIGIKGLRKVEVLQLLLRNIFLYFCHYQLGVSFFVLSIFSYLFHIFGHNRFLCHVCLLSLLCHFTALCKNSYIQGGQFSSTFNNLVTKLVINISFSWIVDSDNLFVCLVDLARHCLSL